MQFFKNIFSGTLHLFYPHVCTGCGSDLLGEDNLLCLRCINDLPHTNFAQHANNPLEKDFWGRIHLTAAHSEFYFAKDSLIQRLIHQLKYNGNQDIGIYLGQLMGRSLVNSNRFNNVDLLIPLPLFAYKEKKRGYNQAAVICKGMSQVMNVPVSIGNVVRTRATETQTKKHRIARWENVEGSFLVNEEEKLRGKNVLLVDDVATTGATLEACGNAIIKIMGTNLSVATLSRANK